MRRSIDNSSPRRRIGLGRRRAMTFALTVAAAMSLAASASASVTYTYDSLGRLASAAYDNGTTVYYAYDENGNRLVQAVSTNSSTGKWGSFNWGAANW